MKKPLHPLEISIIDTIRRNPSMFKRQIATELNTSWSTISTSIRNLTNDGILRLSENASTDISNHKALYRANVYVNKDYEHLVGISVGSSNVTVVFLGFDFSCLEQNGFYGGDNNSSFNAVLKKYSFTSDSQHPNECRWCAKTPAEVTELCSILFDLCNAICELKEQGHLNAAAITFTFPGHINFEKQIIISSKNLCSNRISNASITRFITSSTLKKLEDKDIKVFIDHNVKSCTIAEQEHLFIKQENHKNMMVLYLGKGIGLGMILNNRLYRGNDNLAGQLGQIKLCNGETFESIIRKPFGGDQAFAGMDLGQLQEHLKDSRNSSERSTLVEALVETLNNVIDILGINDIVFSGKFHHVFEIIEMDLIDKFDQLDREAVSLHHSHYEEYSAAVGAAMSCYFNLYDIPFEWR